MKSNLGQLSFLVIDDNANMASIVKIILKNFGASIVYDARDVAEAFSICRQYSIDVVFADYHLGFMDGVAFVRLMRTATDSPNPYMPIIMLSAYSEQARVTAARDAGATEFCVKPVTAAEIYRKIVEVVSHPRPFVRTTGFFGPCRRRRTDDAFTGTERRVNIDRAAMADTEAVA